MSDRSPPGLFVTFEGIDGAGKSSHLASAQAFFESRGRTVLMTREPGGTPLAEALRGLVLHEPMDPLTEALLIFAARRDHVDRRIRPALARGEVVVCDRFSDSTFAYQGAGRNFDLEVLSALERWVQEDLQPDITLWFDLPPSLAAARLRDGRTPDRFESEQQAFFERVRAGYADRARVFPLRFRRIDAEGSRDELRQRVDAALARALDSTATEARLPAGRPTPEK